MKISHAILVAVAGTSVLPSYAAEQTKISMISDVYPMANGSFVISLADEPTHCTSGSTPKRLTIKMRENNMTAEGARQMFAAALTALTSGVGVDVAYDDATSSCYVNRLRLYEN
jgi:hypothetical protein